MASVTSSLDYAAVNLMLRAPRVAVIIDGSDEAWVSAARVALAQCSKVWGGAGFVLVPQQEGIVHPTVLAAVTAYDPDYVAVSARTLAEHELGTPGGFEIMGADDQVLQGDERAEAIARSGDRDYVTDDAHVARETVLAACSPHRMREDLEDGEVFWDDPLHQLSTADPTGSGLTHVNRLSAFVEQACLGAPPQWGGPLGLLAASKLGALAGPTAVSAVAPATGDDATWLAAWLQNLFVRAPDVATELVLNPSGGATFGFQIEQLPFAWQNASAGLTSVVEGSARRGPAWVVIGDSPEEFALWMVLDRLYGNAVWWHSDWFNDHGPESADVAHSLTSDWLRRKGGVHVCTVRANAAEVVKLRDLFQDAIDHPRPGRRTSRKRQVTTGEVPWRREGRLTLAARENFSAEFPVPVLRDGNGGIEMVTRPPGLSLTDALGRAGDRELSWQVDAIFDGSVMPRGRGLIGDELCAPGQDRAHTFVRNSRAGITWHSERFDFTVPGMAPDQQVARPKVRELSLDDWADVMCARQGYTTQLSSAGINAQVLATLWGGRPQMIDDLAGEWRTVLARFGPTGAGGNKGTSQTFEEGHGVVISGHGGILTFAGIAACWSDDEDTANLRTQLDRLVSGRVLRRGLALVCAECRKAAFVAVDELSQKNRCASCSALNDLSQAAWKKPSNEPLWFYDLHPAARSFITMNGDAPLATAHFVKATSRTFTDAAETELVRDGKRVAESDVLIHADGEVLTGEVKTGNELHPNSKVRKSAARKRALWADVLRADEIILATTQKKWADSSVEAMRACMDSYKWTTPGLRPRLRLITGLRGPDAASEYVAW